MRYHVKDAFRWASHSHRNLIPVRLARRILLPSRTFLACLLTCIVGAICYLSLHEPDALYSNNYARKEILQHQLDPEMNVNHFQLPEKKLPSTESRCFYESCPLYKPGFINVHIVPYSHLDLGWEATMDEYFNGVYIPNDNRYAGVSQIIDSVVQQLQMDPSRRFAYSEIAYFWRWWQRQDAQQMNIVRELVSNGRLEFINGGWAENDATVTLYGDIIDQMTLGLTFLNETFGKCGIPKIANNLDSFGTSREQPVLNALMGYDGLFNGRIDYLEKAYRLENQMSHYIWIGSKSLGEAGDMFTAQHYHVNNPPNGFCLENNCPEAPLVVINDDKDSPGYNMDERVDTFLKDCQYQADSSGLDHILYSMGGDLTYYNATAWYDGIDKIVRHANERQSNGSRFNLFYSTPSCFFKALHDMDRTWPVKTDDLLPYGFKSQSYWTGFYSSRPSLKYMIRQGSNLFQSCKQMASVMAMKGGVPNPGNLFITKDAMAVMQHHDAITGTQFANVTEYFIRTLHGGLEECKSTLKAYYENELPLEMVQSRPVVHFCQLNISQCEVSENNPRFVVNVYNGLARHIDKYIRVPVSGASEANYKVYDPKQVELTTQLVPIADLVLRLPGRESDATHELVFLAERLPPLGTTSFFVERLNSDTHNSDDGIKKTIRKKERPLPGGKAAAAAAAPGRRDLIISNEKMKLRLDGRSGLIKSISMGASAPYMLGQEFLSYSSTGAITDDGEGLNHSSTREASGMYAFHPLQWTPTRNDDGVDITVHRGELVDEIHQVYNDWLGQVIRLYKGQSHVEFDWVVGPIPLENYQGQEIISRFTSELKSDATFYVDANGRQTVKRVRDYRESFNYTDTSEPIAHNYYPVNSHIYLKDAAKGTHLAILVDRAQGGSSLQDGQLELMVHRRMVLTDFFPEALNETAYGRGLVARGTHWMILNEADDGVKWIRSLSQEMYRSPQITFAPTGLTGREWFYKHRTQKVFLTRALPENVNLLTFEPRSDGKYLIRLEHIYEVEEDPVLSQPVTVSLDGLFDGFQVTSIEELMLGANVLKKDLKPFKWTRKREDVAEDISRGSPIDLQADATIHSIELQPMQIRTFIITVEARS